MVKLISTTIGAGEDTIGRSAQDILGYITRVSAPNNQANFDTIPKLLAYCIKHEHWSPFEHAYFTVEIETTRAIAAQILRHRSFTFQEFSQRYAEAADFSPVEARRQDLKNRQNSVDDLSAYDKCWFEEAQDHVWNTAYGLYKHAITKGIAKEQARFLLPLNTKTRIYMTGSVRSWIHYIKLRTHEGTQKEHRDVAEDCKKIFINQFPDVAKALEW